MRKHLGIIHMIYIYIYTARYQWSYSLRYLDWERATQFQLSYYTYSYYSNPFKHLTSKKLPRAFYLQKPSSYRSLSNKITVTKSFTIYSFYKVLLKALLLNINRAHHSYKELYNSLSQLQKAKNFTSLLQLQRAYKIFTATKKLKALQ